MAEAWLIKLNAQGEKEWHQCYGGSYIDYFSFIIELTDGYLISGSTQSSDGDINNFHGTVGENNDVWLVRTDLNGDIIWSNCYGGSKHESGYKIVQNDGNTFTIIGSTNSSDGDVQGNTASNNASISWMIKIDENGNLLYQKPFDEEPYLRGGDYVKISDYKYVISSTKDFGCNYTWGNNNDDIYVYEIQDMDEFTPSQAIGADRVCLGIENETYYRTNLVIDTMETQWLLEPEAAGSMTAMHDSVLIHRNIDFHDTAWLQVRAVNEYGESSYSQAKEIIVYPALNLLGISGPDSICTAVNAQTTFYTSNPNDNELNWLIEPETAGTITTIQDTAIITWRTSYEGEVKLQTAATNNCGTAEYSPNKTVQLKTCLGIGEQTYRRLKVYPNPAKDYIIFELPQNTQESSLIISDIFGEIIVELAIKEQSQIKWDCQNTASGVYFYQTEIGEVVYYGKIVVSD